MSDIEKIQLFEDQKVRTIWIEGEEKWYFSIKDVVLVLADAKAPKDYLSKMRRREPELAKGWGQIVHPLVVRTPGGPQKENFANLEGMFRIIQSLQDYKRLGYSDNWINQRLKQENLRDNMTNEELVMNMLAELTTSNITKEEHPETMSEHARVAERGGSVAKVAKDAFEKQTGKKVVSPLSMKR